MIFNFKNVGLIQSAKIELKGLTVLAGLNDTAKSFISKSIYSVIKTINESSNLQKAQQREEVQQVVTQAFLLYRQNAKFAPAFTIDEETNPTLIWQKAVNALQSSLTSDVILILEKYREKLIELLSDIKKTNPKNISDVELKITNLFNGLIKSISNEDNSENVYKKFFDNVIIDKLFKKQMSSVNSNDDLIITCTEGEDEILNIAVSGSSTKSFKLNSSLIYNDATLIETPTILQISKFITDSLAYSFRPGQAHIGQKLYQQRTALPHHFFDLNDKLRDTVGSSDNDLSTTISNLISEIIHGKIVYDLKDNDFVYIKEPAGKKINSFNIANGIKSFGIIQLLLSSSYINNKSLLIIDEPEVYLHPEWQVRYAELIVLLAKKEIPIIISSHSPYIINAIEAYSKKHDFVDKVNYYLGEKDDSGNVNYKPVSDDLQPIYSALASPLQSLDFIR